MVHVNALADRIEHLSALKNRHYLFGQQRKVVVQSPPAAPPAKHPEYWFGDGNIVLVAKQKIAFRVHASVLGRKSLVFGDLLGIPQPAAQELVDDCPVIHIADDPVDFAVFLAYVYDGWDHHKSQVRPIWDVTKAMLLMGDKYDVEELRDTAMQQLERLFPPTAPCASRCSTPISRAASPSPMAHSPADVIAMAGASRNLSSPRLRIAILYQCCLLDVATLVASLSESGDGTLSLTSQEFYQCLSVRAQLPQQWRQIYQDLFAPLCTPYCRRLSTCGWVVEVVRDEFLAGYEDGVLAGTAYDPLDVSVWNRLLAMADKRGICESCHLMWCKRYVELRERAMDHLAQGFSPQNCLR